MSSVGEDVEKLDPLYIAGGSVNDAAAAANSLVVFLKIARRTTTRSSDFTPEDICKRIETRN